MVLSLQCGRCKRELGTKRICRNGKQERNSVISRCFFLISIILLESNIISDSSIPISFSAFDVFHKLNLTFESIPFHLSYSLKYSSFLSFIPYLPCHPHSPLLLHFPCFSYSPFASSFGLWIFVKPSYQKFLNGFSAFYLFCLYLYNTRKFSKPP